MAEVVFKEESYRIIGACFEVYKHMGAGFLEAVYQECLAIEFSDAQILYASHCALQLQYRGRILVQTYVPDFVCYGKIIIELKAVRELGNEHRAQVHNYLKASGFKLGLLVNFGHTPQLEWERIVN